MSKNPVFTRAKLKEIAPTLTPEQQDAIIELYLTASYRFKTRMVELEKDLENIAEDIRKAMSK